MKKFQSLVILFLALLLVVSVPAQAFAATKGDHYHIHCWKFHERTVSVESVGSAGHKFITRTYHKCTGCGEKIVTETEVSNLAKHSYNAGTYTGENFHVEGTEEHRARFRKTCSICRYTTLEWVAYYCSGRGQHVLPYALRPILVEK